MARKRLANSHGRGGFHVSARSPKAASLELKENDPGLSIFQLLSINGSAELIRAADKKLRPPGMAPVFRRLELCVIDPDEIFNELALVSLSRFSSVRQLMQQIARACPDSLKTTREVEITEIDQFDDYVGVGLNYPEFIEARDVLCSAVNKISGSSRKWSETEPHLKLFAGNVDQLNSNPSEITLPGVVDLQPATFGQSY